MHTLNKRDSIGAIMALVFLIKWLGIPSDPAAFFQVKAIN